MARTLTFEAVFKAGFAVGIGVSKAYEANSGGRTGVANTVNVSQESSPGNRPLVPVYGHFRDDPTWDDFMAGIQEYRRQLNETED